MSQGTETISALQLLANTTPLAALPLHTGMGDTAVGSQQQGMGIPACSWSPPQPYHLSSVQGLLSICFACWRSWHPVFAE